MALVKLALDRLGAAGGAATAVFAAALELEDKDPKISDEIAELAVDKGAAADEDESVGVGLKPAKGSPEPDKALVLPAGLSSGLGDVVLLIEDNRG